MALQSNVDLHLLSGLLPFSSVFDLSFQFVILHLLMSVCTQFHIWSCYPHLSSHMLFYCLGWFPSVRLLRSQVGFPNSCFYGDRLLAHCPIPNLEGQSTVFITSEAKWSRYTPRHHTAIWFTFYDLHGLQWDFFSLVTTQGYIHTHTHTHKYI